VSADRLIDRVNVLRDEVLEIAELGGGELGGGGEIFDAIVRHLDTRLETSPGLDMVLREAINRRLAWGDAASAILADADGICRRTLDAAERSFREPRDELHVARAVAEVGCAVSRFVTLGAMTRAGRDRAAQLREELAQSRLRQALSRQKEELERLNRALSVKF
jgi:hypothetical protein